MYLVLSPTFSGELLSMLQKIGFHIALISRPKKNEESGFFCIPTGSAEYIPITANVAIVIILPPNCCPLQPVAGENQPHCKGTTQRSIK